MNDLSKYRIRSFEIGPGFTLSLTFVDGRSSTVDLSQAIGKGLLSRLSDKAYFDLVQLKEGGILEWPSGEDIDPEALYHWQERRSFYENQTA